MKLAQIEEKGLSRQMAGPGLPATRSVSIKQPLFRQPG
jgi:hypothetical protein